MKKAKIKLLLFVALLFLIRGVSFAGVAGSKHDMYFLGKGIDPNICSYCHIPHNAAGDKIWSKWANEARLSGSYTVIGNMCYTCHDGTATNIGQSTAFNTSLQQHKISSGQDCDMCHSVHDNTNSMFMRVVKTQDSYCAACHNSTANAGGFGDMTGAGNHPNYWPAKPNHYASYSPYKNTSCVRCHNDSNKSDDGSCSLCHSTHSAVQYATSNLTNPILKAVNVSGYCARCHWFEWNNSGQKPMHPSSLATPGQWGVIDCEECHGVHQPDKPNNPKLLLDQNVNSAFCKTCHDRISASKGPMIGDSHPEDVSYSLTPMTPVLTPAGNAIDDDVKNGSDYPANSANLICETCHSVHIKGVVSPLLRINNTGGALCLNCHTDK